MAGSAAQARPDRPVLQAVAGDEPIALFIQLGRQGRRARELAQLPRSHGPQRRRSRSDEDWRGTAIGRRRRVAAIGEKVTRVKVGDRIAGCFHPRWFGRPIKPDYLTDRLGANLHGVLAEYAVLSEEALVHTPHHLSFEEAATLPCAAVTAQVAFSGHLRVTAGDIILAQDSGDVSVFALQLARILGAQVIATTSATEKAERLKGWGRPRRSTTPRHRIGTRRYPT